MEIIGKISKGSKMDQVYIPKNRAGFSIGDYVVIKPLEEEKPIERLYYHGIKNLEPIKINIIDEILGIIYNSLNNYDNIIITGSFLEEGFNFNDIDIILITKNKINTDIIKMSIERKTGLKAHILVLNNKELIKGIETDPLYQMMLSKCVAKKRFVYKTNNVKNYKLLDLHLIKSKVLLDNFDVLSGNEKYNLTRNMIAISLYIEKGRVNNELVNENIKKYFGLKDIQEIKQNIINKKDFLRKYKLMYNKTSAKILERTSHDTKQK